MRIQPIGLKTTRTVTVPLKKGEIVSTQSKYHMMMTSTFSTIKEFATVITCPVTKPSTTVDSTINKLDGKLYDLQSVLRGKCPELYSGKTIRSCRQELLLFYFCRIRYQIPFSTSSHFLIKLSTESKLKTGKSLLIFSREMSCLASFEMKLLYSFAQTYVNGNHCQWSRQSFPYIAQLQCGYLIAGVITSTILLKLLPNLSSDRRVFSAKTRRPISVKTNYRQYCTFNKNSCQKSQIWTERYYSSAFCYLSKFSKEIVKFSEKI